MWNKVEKGYWAINFDLDTKKAEQYHPSGTRQGAYSELKNFFEEHNFEHRQYSGYVSKEEMTAEKLRQTIECLVIEQPYIKDYVRRMDATIVQPTYIYDCTTLFRISGIKLSKTEDLSKKQIKKDEGLELTLTLML